MNLTVRDGKFDVVIAAGPRIDVWPSIAVQTLSKICSESGLSVAHYGGEFVKVRGVLPLQGTGGVVFIEDSQHRIHRIRARAIIRIASDSHLPDPFAGWYSQGLIPIQTAEKLLTEKLPLFEPLTVILGTGNRALRLGSMLLETEASTEVYCIESFVQWKSKRFAGWEVDRRRFEMLGGKLLEAKPIQLSRQAPLSWQLRLQDAQGIRILETGRVISAGPFRELRSIREYPPGSLLFEMDQIAGATYTDNIEGWNFEIEGSTWLASKIVKALVSDLGKNKENIDRLFRRARKDLKNHLTHQETPFTPSYQGKWILPADSRKLRSFSGIPQKLHKNQLIASIECFEEIHCQACQKVCPTSAIQLGKVPRGKGPVLNEEACIACGLCVSACPSSAISMIHEKENQSASQITLLWGGKKKWAEGELTQLVNRRGENLGSARICAITPSTSPHQQLIQVTIPSHLVWEGASSQTASTRERIDPDFLQAMQRPALHEEKIEISFNGERRFVRDKALVSTASF